MIRSVIIEDNEKEVKLLRQLLATDSRFSLHPTIINHSNWKYHMQAGAFDVVFADIELNGRNVFNLLKNLSYKPEVVVVTNYPKYALQAFDSGVIHFLTKPLKKEHIYTALERVHRKFLLKEHYPVPESFFIQVGRNKYEHLFFNDIIAVKSESEYIRFILQNDKPVLVYQRLKNILSDLPTAQFIQVHRSVIVNVKYIRSVEGNTLVLSNKEQITIGASFKNQILSLVNK